MEVSEQEFLNIIDQNERPIRHLCRIYAAGREEREDLYQEIIVQIWRSFPNFNGRAKRSTWIYRIGINTAISFLRKRETRKDYNHAYKKEQRNNSSSEKSPAKQLVDDEKVAQLYKAISTLNASEKAIITMYLEEFSYEDIAYTLDISENYVGVKLNRIKKKLSEKLGKHYET